MTEEAVAGLVCKPCDGSYIVASMSGFTGNDAVEATSGSNSDAVYHDTCPSKFSDLEITKETIEKHLRTAITEDGVWIGGPGLVATERAVDNVNLVKST